MTAGASYEGQRIMWQPILVATPAGAESGVKRDIPGRCGNALARKLLVALWRLCRDGLLPKGAALKAI